MDLMLVMWMVNLLGLKLDYLMDLMLVMQMVSWLGSLMD